MSPEDLRNRPMAYFNIDGVGELSMGFMMLAMATFGWLLAHAPAGSAWHSMPVFIVYMAVLLAVLHYAPRAIKERLTYLRTGYVEYRKQGAWKVQVLSAAIAPLVVIGLVVASRHHWSIGVPAGLLLATFAAVYGYRIAGTIRWKWAVVAVIFLGAVAMVTAPRAVIGALIEASVLGAVYTAFAMIGVVMLVSGGITLASYIRHTEPPQAESE